MSSNCLSYFCSILSCFCCISSCFDRISFMVCNKLLIIYWSSFWFIGDWNWLPYMLPSCSPNLSGEVREFTTEWDDISSLMLDVSISDWFLNTDGLLMEKLGWFCCISFYFSTLFSWLIIFLPSARNSRSFFFVFPLMIAAADISFTCSVYVGSLIDCFRYLIDSLFFLSVESETFLLLYWTLGV